MLDKRKAIEIALQSSRLADLDTEATEFYIYITEHLIQSGQVNSLEDLDLIMDSMTVDEAEEILVDYVPNYIRTPQRALATDLTMTHLKSPEASSEAIRVSLRGASAELPSWIRGKINTAIADLGEVATYLNAK